MSSKKAKGKRSKTRDLFKRRTSKPKINDMLKEFEKGDKVTLRIQPAIHKGLPFRRFQNLPGVIIEKRGRAYVVSVKHGEKQKDIISTSIHLKATA